MSNLSLKIVLNLIDKITKPLKGVHVESQRLTDALSKQSKALISLKRTQNDVESFKRLKSALKDTNQNLAAAKLATEKLTREHAALPKVTRTMTRELERAQKSVERLTNLKIKQASQIRQNVTLLNQAGINTNQLRVHEKGLTLQIESATRALQSQSIQLSQVQAKQAAIAQAHANYEGTSNFESQIGSVAAQAAISASVGAAGLSVPITAFAEAEDAWTQLQVTMMQSNGKVAPEFQKISDLATNMGNQLPGTTAEFQAMMSKLVQQGISFKDILGGVGKASGNLGVLLKMPFEDAAEFAAKMQDATKTEAKDMIGLMDTIQKSFFLGVDPTNMLSGFSKISAGMKTIKAEGLSGAKAIAPLLIMADQASMAGEAAGNAYSKIFKGMLDTSKISKSLKGTNMSMNFTDGKGEFGGMENMFKQLEKLKSLSTEARLPILSDMFGNDTETIQALNLLIDKGQTGYNETIQKMKSQADLQQRVNAQLDTLKSLWDAATGTFTNTMVTLGESIKPELKSLTKWITDLAARLDVWIKANPQLVKTLMLIAMGIVALLAVIAALAFTLMTILVPIKLLRLALAFLRINLISSTVAAWRFSVSMLGMALNTLKSGAIMAGSRIIAFLTLLKAQLISSAVAAWAFMAPFLPLIAAVTLLALAAFLIYKNWGPIKEFFLSLWEAVGTKFNEAVENIKAKWADIGTWFSNKWTQIQAFFNSGIGNISATILNWSPLGLFYTAFAKVLSWFGIDLPAKFTGFGGMMLEGLKNGILSKVQAVKDALSSAVTGVIDKARKLLDIHSPSRVFAQIGDYTMQGMALGITNNQMLPSTAMSTATNNLIPSSSFTSNIQKIPTAKTTTAIRPITAANGRHTGFISQDNIQIHIHVKDGSVVKGTSEALRHELRRVVQEEQTAKRKFLTDSE